MADEIRELTREPIGRNLLAFNVLYLFQVNPAIVVNGTPVVLRPRGDLPPGVIQFGVLNSDELDEIDVGTLTFDTDYVRQKHSDEPLAQVLVRVQIRYAAQAAVLVPMARIRYANFGKKRDA
jgi:hypothetical protein